MLLLANTNEAAALVKQNMFLKQLCCPYICPDWHPFKQQTADFLRQIDYFSNQRESTELTAHGVRNQTTR